MIETCVFGYCKKRPCQLNKLPTVKGILDGILDRLANDLVWHSRYLLDTHTHMCEYSTSEVRTSWVPVQKNTEGESVRESLTGSRGSIFRRQSIIFTSQ